MDSDSDSVSPPPLNDQKTVEMKWEAAYLIHTLQPNTSCPPF